MIAQLDRQTQDQCIIQSGRTWEQFKLIQAGFEDSRGVRLFYYNHTIEILMPGRDHEFFSRFIGFLVGVYCMDKGVEFEPLGSMTQEQEGVVSTQADESYTFGNSKPTPDLAIEITFTSGNASKLNRYGALGVPEVWFWEDGLFSLYHLRSSGYEQIDRSEIPELAALDIELLTRCVLMAQTSRLAAIAEFRQAISSSADRSQQSDS
ncbi:MAG: Uma2 family endonuclease [Myxacorys chilensis ATA2-1-KO14]|jgi:Uma2 family endonuclease|nr:Uma2 family endonuclease [Myxacorys chilensis ATA2-1-KO14]